MPRRRKTDPDGSAKPGRPLELPAISIDDIDPGLTELQRKFVVEYALGDGVLTAAAERAGYSKANLSARTYELMRNPLVLKEIARLSQQRLAFEAPAAIGRMARLSASAKSEFVRMQATQDILDRAGYKPPDRSQQLVAGDLTVRIDLSEAKGG